MSAIKPSEESNKPSEESNDKPKIIHSNTPTSFTDEIILGIETNGETDNLILMRLISAIPDLMIENHRTVLKLSAAKSLIDVLCDITGHYPQKPRKKTPKK